MRAVHFSRGGRTPEGICKPGARWSSKQITTVTNEAKVTCKTCKRMLSK